MISSVATYMVVAKSDVRSRKVDIFTLSLNSIKDIVIILVELGVNNFICDNAIKLCRHHFRPGCHTKKRMQKQERTN